MIVNSPRIFGKKDKFFTVKSKVLKRRKGGEKHGMFNSPLGVVAVIILILSVLLGGSYFVNLLMKDKFIVRKIVVEGYELVSKKEILNAAKAEEGGDLFQLDMYDAKLRIEKIPQILSARIIRELPDTLIIKVVERSARAIVKSNDGSFLVCVDSEGLLLPESATGGLDDITCIYGVEVGDPKPGRFCEDKNLLTALKVLKLHDGSKLKEQVNVESVIIDKGGEVQLHERERNPSRRLYKVHLGKEDIEQRLANLIVILDAELKRSDRQDRIINLTFERPVSVPVILDGGS